MVGALAAWGWSSPEPRGPSAYAEALDALLRTTQPRWVIVGNSKAMMDVDERRLGRKLGFEGAITPVVLTGSTAPAWYAMLEQRVFGEGYRPELVIVYGQLGALLRERPLGDTETHSIEGLSDKPSVILDTRVFGLAANPLGRGQERAFREHERVVAAMREWIVGGLFAPRSEGGLREAGRAEWKRAWEAVYGDGAGVRTSGNTRMVPGEATNSTAAMAEGAAGTTFVDAILRLCHSAGARVLFVRAPVGALVAGRDDVPPEVEAALYAHINAAGASWIDLHAIPLPAGAFRDDFHLLPAGAAVLTAALAERMDAADVHHGGVAPAAPPFGATSVMREGAGPPLVIGATSPMRERACGWRAEVSGLDPATLSALADEALADAGLGGTSPFVFEVDSAVLAGSAAAKDFGAACSGSAALRAGEVRVSPVSGVAPKQITVRVTDAPSVTAEGGRTTWWVPPGTTLRWAFAAPPSGESPRVEAVIRVLAGSSATMWVNDEAVAFTAAGRALRAEAPVPAGPWRLGIESGPDTWLVVHSLAAVAAETNYVVGGPWAETHLLQARPRFSADPPPIAVTAVDQGGSLWRVDLPQWAALADDQVQARVGRRCSPVEVQLGEGEFRKPDHAKLAQLGANHWGTAHEGGALWWLGEGPPPTAARLNPERSCTRGGKYFPGWLYAGDVATIALASSRLASHPLGINALRVDAVAVGGDVTLEVVVRKRVRGGWDVEWRGEELFPEAAGRMQVPVRIDPPLGVEGNREVELHVVGGYLLAYDVLLSESESAPTE